MQRLDVTCDLAAVAILFVAEAHGQEGCQTNLAQRLQNSLRVEYSKFRPARWGLRLRSAQSIGLSEEAESPGSRVNRLERRSRVAGEPN